jgi:hypothetical protein
MERIIVDLTSGTISTVIISQSEINKNKPTEEYFATQTAQITAQIDTLLTASDWTQVADAPVDKAAWATYRQELRDISAQTGFPATVVWPTQPE